MKYVSLCLLLLALVFCGTAHAENFKAISESLKKPILLDDGESPRMNVTFQHSSHRGIKCSFCHHAAPSNGPVYSSCAGNEECHYLKGSKERDVQSVFMAYHSKDSERSCYSCHKKLASKYPAFRGCQPCHSAQAAAKAQ